MKKHTLEDEVAKTFKASFASKGIKTAFTDSFEVIGDYLKTAKYEFKYSKKKPLLRITNRKYIGPKKIPLDHYIHSMVHDYVEKSSIELDTTKHDIDVKSEVKIPYLKTSLIGTLCSAVLRSTSGNIDVEMTLTPDSSSLPLSKRVYSLKSAVCSYGILRISYP